MSFLALQSVFQFLGPAAEADFPKEQTIRGCGDDMPHGVFDLKTYQSYSKSYRTNHTTVRIISNHIGGPNLVHFGHGPFLNLPK